MLPTFDYAPPLTVAPADHVFYFHRGRLALDAQQRPAQGVSPDNGGPAHRLGQLADASWYAVASQSEALPSGCRWASLREALLLLPAELALLANRAQQLLEWDRSHRFCGACGQATHDHPTERNRQCPACGQHAYPRISPAMMVLVRRDRQLLLARSPHFPAGVYSALAGFVEAGETLEQCVQREVLEEVGLQVGNLRYFGSQSWPFPHSLMLAFLADYVAGDIVPQPGEIEDARWFALDELPLLPSPVSIARHLIQAVIADLRQG